mmetsp:Transcript_36139/g.64318  ORF Transcript_36139/g.64318 Transcript_36139/m.64318 type:complete len:165 (+) Transcript_36139:60-554(+)
MLFCRRADLFTAVLSVSVIAEYVELRNATPCGSKRSPYLPDPGPGTCVDVGKCCNWTWPPALTTTLSCVDDGKPGPCFKCKPPNCCCESGTMVVTQTGAVDVASCCDLFFPVNGTMCSNYFSNGTANCGPSVKLCKAFGKADCDKCANFCSEFYDEHNDAFLQV